MVGVTAFVSRPQNHVGLFLPEQRAQQAGRFAEMKRHLLVAKTERQGTLRTYASQAQRGQHFPAARHRIFHACGEALRARVKHIARRAIGSVHNPQIGKMTKLAAGPNHLIVRVRRHEYNASAPLHTHRFAKERRAIRTGILMTRCDYAGFV